MNSSFYTCSSSVWLMNKTRFIPTISRLPPRTWRCVWEAASPVQIFIWISLTNKLAPVGIHTNSWRAGYCGALWVPARSSVICVRSVSSVFWSSAGLMKADTDTWESEQGKLKLADTRTDVAAVEGRRFDVSWTAAAQEEEEMSAEEIKFESLTLVFRSLERNCLFLIWWRPEVCVQGWK